MSSIKFDELSTKILKLIPLGSPPARNGLYTKQDGSLGFAVAGVEIFTVRAPGAASAPSARCVHSGGRPPATNADGTDTAFVVTDAYLCELIVPESGVKAIGVALMNGTAVAGNVQATLYDVQGSQIATTASTAQAGTSAYQRIPFTAAVNLIAGTYYLCIQGNNTGGKITTHVFGDFGAGLLTGQVYGTPPATPALPTTFTTNQGPIASLY